MNLQDLINKLDHSECDPLISLPKIAILRVNYSKEGMGCKVSFPTTLNLSSLLETKMFSSYKYELYAFIIHQGATYQSGHYVAIIKAEKNWKLLNDSLVENITDVDSYLQSSPVLLFYSQTT